MQGADVDKVDKRGRTPLYWACSFGNIEAVKFLRKMAAALEIVGRGERTLLHATTYLMRRNQKACAMDLINASMSVHARDKNGRTPLAVAAYKGNADAVKLLWSRQADVNSHDKKGRTPLHDACRNDHCESAETLIDLCGCDLTPADYFGRTPFHIAAYKVRQCWAIAVLLLLF